MLGLSRISPTNLSSGLGCTRVKLLRCCSYLARRESAPTETLRCDLCGVGGRASQPMREMFFRFGFWPLWTRGLGPHFPSFRRSPPTSNFAPRLGPHLELFTRASPTSDFFPAEAPLQVSALLSALHSLCVVT